MNRTRSVAASLTFEEVIALAPCPYKRCSAPTNIPCMNTDVPHKSRAQAAFRITKRARLDAAIDDKQAVAAAQE